MGISIDINDNKNKTRRPLMALNREQEMIVSETKEKLKLVNQISKLQKEIVGTRKKLELKENKLSELVKSLQPTEKDPNNLFGNQD